MKGTYGFMKRPSEGERNDAIASGGGERPAKHIGKAISILGDAPDTHMDRSVLAARLDISPDYLGKIFKELTGTTLREFENSLRVEAARELLGTTELPLPTIARRAGFGSLRTFFRVFRHHTGLTPARFRDNRRQCHLQTSYNGTTS